MPSTIALIGLGVRADTVLGVLILYTPKTEEVYNGQDGFKGEVLATLSKANLAIAISK
ncbi:MAG: hypothetical protein OSB19_06885 [Opitutaceae bacterium]|nr:hypothetical protein [Opitutaceae bacterium]